jgi:hypothetical protein
MSGSQGENYFGRLPHVSCPTPTMMIEHSLLPLREEMKIFICHFPHKKREKNG